MRDVVEVFKDHAYRLYRPMVAQRHNLSLSPLCTAKHRIVLSSTTMFYQGFGI